MKRTKRSPGTLVFGLLLAVCLGFPIWAANAAAVTVAQYPFATGEDAFAGGVRFYSTNDKEQDSWMVGGLNGSFDIENAEYIALQMKNNGAAVSFDLGYEANTTRYHMTDGQKVYWITPDGAAAEDAVLYASIHMPANFEGMLLAPKAAFSYQFGDAAQDMRVVKNIHITTNSLYNYWIDVTVGEVGYYTADPAAEDAEYVKLSDKNPTDPAWINGTWISGGMAREFVKSKAQAAWDDLEDVQIAYAFNGSLVMRTKAAGIGTIRIEPASADWAGVTGIEFELWNYGAAANAAISVKDETIVPVSGTASLTPQSGESSETAVTGGKVALPAGFKGTVRLNVDGIANAEEIRVTLDAAENSGVKLALGQTGATRDGSTYKLMAKGGSDTAIATYYKIEGAGITVFKFAERYASGAAAPTLGEDVKLTQTYDAMENPLVPWTGGAPGTTELVTRGDGKAMKFTVGAYDSAKDPYMATDIPLMTAGSRDADDWSGAKGVTFYTENLSALEVAFNIEFNLNDVSTGKMEREERFNIRFGARYYLYDVVTGVEYIYVAKPVITVPVGFKGYVRVPFSAYKKAEWAAGDGVLDPQDLATYMCVTCDARDYEGFEYLLDDVGVYYNAFELNTSFHRTENSVPGYMGLTEEK